MGCWAALGGVLEVDPLRSLVGAQGGEERLYVLFVTAVPPSQTLYWIVFFFFLIVDQNTNMSTKSSEF